MTAPEITIPEEALEEAEKAVIEALDPGYPASPGFIARAACLAMLKAWETDTHRMIVGTALDEVGGTYPAIILPLTENTNDKA